jgi:hypothetical protein
MTQDGGNAEQFQEAHEGIRTLPLKAVECGIFLYRFARRPTDRCVLYACDGNPSHTMANCAVTKFCAVPILYDWGKDGRRGISERGFSDVCG